MRMSLYRFTQLVITIITIFTEISHMWEKRSVGKTILNILIFLIIAVLAGGLYYAMQRVQANSAEHDKELSQLYEQQKQVQEEARQESALWVQAEYEKDMETVAKYMPGIVCWGDNTTAAAFGSLNYPYVLQTYINTYICDTYDFVSTLDTSAALPRMDWDQFKFSIPVVNMGAGKETTYTILGRAGAIPYVLGEDIVIPAECEPVKVYLLSEGGQIVNPLTGGDAGVNPVTIEGIEGTLTINSEDYSYGGMLHYTFTRATPGEETPAPKGTVVKTAATDLYKDYISVILIGIYGEFTNADDLVKQVRTLLSRQTNNPERFIVLGPYVANAYAYSSYQLDAVDTAMQQAFDNRYISIRKYLVGDGYIDAGLSPTHDDGYYTSQYIVPPTFKTGTDSIELNSIAHKLIGKLIFNRMQSLGYFDEISEELHLSEVTNRILKDSPGYFETVIQNILK